MIILLFLVFIYFRDIAPQQKRLIEITDSPLDLLSSYKGRVCQQIEDCSMLRSVYLDNNRLHGLHQHSVLYVYKIS